ncbi:hypothetical protein J4216_02700 [Candidatus Woesearchaeota archaeon]|nr:hypothetical protein [Candidatus Woesearchaeota archaeon]
MSKGNKSSGTSATNLFLGVASITAGAYHGYMDSQGIPIERENLEFALTYGPALVRGGLGGLTGGLVGGGVGTVLGLESSSRFDDGLEKVAKGIGGATLGSIGGAALGGTLGAITGGIQTLVGYGIGYMAGYILK